MLIIQLPRAKPVTPNTTLLALQSYYEAQKEEGVRNRNSLEGQSQQVVSETSINFAVAFSAELITNQFNCPFTQ